MILDTAIVGCPWKDQAWHHPPSPNELGWEVLSQPDPGAGGQVCLSVVSLDLGSPATPVRPGTPCAVGWRGEGGHTQSLPSKASLDGGGRWVNKLYGKGAKRGIGGVGLR